MRNAMQLKAIINNIAKEKGVRPQLALQNYMLERFLERVSLSQYCDIFIIYAEVHENEKNHRNSNINNGNSGCCFSDQGAEWDTGIYS